MDQLPELGIGKHLPKARRAQKCPTTEGDHVKPNSIRAVRGGCGQVCPAPVAAGQPRACQEAGRCLRPQDPPWVMTPEQIAPHQVPVHRVIFVREYQAITGDWWMEFRAPDGELAEIRTACGAYATPGTPVWSRRRARRHALEQLNRKRAGRALRMEQGQPVTCNVRNTR